MPKRCTWVAGGNELLKQYHDSEWGTPCHSDQKLFELLSLEIFQAGLSWQTVLNKRQALNDALADFDFQILLSFEGQLPKLLTNQAIIRNRRKLLAVIHNAQIVSDMFTRGQSFDTYLWQFVHYQPIQHHYQSYLQIPKTNQLAMQVSRTMKTARFQFTGPVVSYSFLQAAGIINDHETTCFRYSKLNQPKK